MFKASVLQNIGLFSTFYVEKPTALLSFSNENEQRKKRKIVQRIRKENKYIDLQSHCRHDV
jgi:hypothetical protein